MDIQGQAGKIDNGAGGPIADNTVIHDVVSLPVGSNPDLPLEAHYRKFVKEACEICGCSHNLEVHHCIPKDVFIALGISELYDDPRNLVTLCDCPNHQCHRTFGHLASFTRWNPYLPDMLPLLKAFADNLKKGE